MTFALDVKKNALLALTGLAVAYVRRVVQYHHYSWDSIGQFLSWWLIHYLGLFLFIAIAYACIRGTEKFFFGGQRSRPGLGVDEAIIYISLVVLAAAVSIFLLAHWVLTESDG